MIECGFHGFEGAKAVGALGGDSDLVGEAFDDTAGTFSFGERSFEDERLVAAEHAGDFLHGLNATAHRSLVPGFREAPGAVDGAVRSRGGRRLP